MEKYYIQYSYGEQEGPLDFENIKSLILIGDVKEDDKLWDDKKNEWVDVSGFEEFKEALELKKNSSQEEKYADKKIILLVDDDASLLGLLEDMFEEDYTVLTARDGLTALKIIHRRIPSVVLLDVMLPRLTGHMVLKRLRADKKTKDIPVIMLTAKSAAADKLLGIELSANEYIPKPFDIEVLEKTVKKFCG
ncbi:MAG: response regulator [Elusimicrobia bacterium]|nr:response regulator [Elusimicrobiota bacterium]